MHFQNQHIVIAGGSSGIGFAIAAQALARGARVTLVGRSEAKLAAARVRLKGEVVTQAFDLGDATATKAGFARIGAYHHFVSTAADLSYGALATLERSAITRMLAGKFWGPVNLVQHGLAQLQPGGSILLFSGLAADRPAAGTAVVSALNAGVEGLVRALAVELAPLRVNGISPGVVDTEGWAFMDDASRASFYERLAAQLPSGRIGVPADLADAALFVLGNDYLTGEILHVNGGGNLI